MWQLGRWQVLRYTPDHLEPEERGLCKLGHARANLPPFWRVFQFAAGAARADAYPACSKRVRVAGRWGGLYVPATSQGGRGLWLGWLASQRMPLRTDLSMPQHWAPSHHLLLQ